MSIQTVSTGSYQAKIDQIYNGLKQKDKWVTVNLEVVNKENGFVRFFKIIFLPLARLFGKDPFAHIRANKVALVILEEFRSHQNQLTASDKTKVIAILTTLEERTKKHHGEELNQVIASINELEVHWTTFHSLTQEEDDKETLKQSEIPQELANAALQASKNPASLRRFKTEVEELIEAIRDNDDEGIQGMTNRTLKNMYSPKKTCEQMIDELEKLAKFLEEEKNKKKKTAAETQASLRRAELNRITQIENEKKQKEAELRKKLQRELNDSELPKMTKLASKRFFFEMNLSLETYLEERQILSKWIPSGNLTDKEMINKHTKIVQIGQAWLSRQTMG